MRRLRFWIAVLRARMHYGGSYLACARYLGMDSELAFGTDENYWWRVSRFAPHQISVHTEEFIPYVGWIVANGYGLWSLRGAHHRRFHKGDAEFRHVFYFSDPNDAFAFRMQFVSKVGDVPENPA